MPAQPLYRPEYKKNKKQIKNFLNHFFASLFEAAPYIVKEKD